MAMQFFSNVHRKIRAASRKAYHKNGNSKYALKNSIYIFSTIDGILQNVRIFIVDWFKNKNRWRMKI